MQVDALAEEELGVLIAHRHTELVKPSEEAGLRGQIDREARALSENRRLTDDHGSCDELRSGTDDGATRDLGLALPLVLLLSPEMP